MPLATEVSIFHPEVTSLNKPFLSIFIMCYKHWAEPVSIRNSCSDDGC